jgi:hypothetical protein
MLSMLHSAAHTFAVNCGPRLEVIVVGTPKPVIQWKARARAQSAAEIQSWAPALFSRFCARERKAIKKAREGEEKKREKSESAERERKKREFALFFSWGDICMYVCTFVCMYLRMYICMWGCKYGGMYVCK